MLWTTEDEVLVAGIRADLARYLEWRHVPDEVWSHLSEQGYVVDAVTVYERPFHDQRHEDRQRELQEMANAAMEFIQQHPAAANALIHMPRSIIVPGTVLIDEDLERAMAESYAIAMVANEFEIVKEYRKAQLGGSVLSPMDAVALLSKDLPASGWYDLDPIDHRDGRAAHVGWWYEHLDMRDLRDRLPTGMFIELPFVEVPGGTAITDQLPRFRKWKESRLRKAAEQLERWLPWSEGDAVWFLLTDQVPFVSPIHVQFDVSEWWRSVRSNEPEYVRGEITVRHATWLSDTSIRRAQSHVLQRIRGGKNRKITVRVLRLFRVIAETLQTTGTRPSLAETMRLWSVRYPNEKPFIAEKTVSRAYRRSLEALVRPDYQTSSKDDQSMTGGS